MGFSINRPSFSNQNNVAKPKRTGAKVAAAAATATAAVATTLVLAKKGKLNPVEGGNKIIEAIKVPLKKFADKILNIIAGSKVVANVLEKVGKAQTKISPVTKKVSAKAQETRCKLSGVAEKVKTKLEPASKKAAEIKEGVIADSEVFVENAKTSFRNASKKAGEIKEGVIADSEVFVENAKTTFRNASKKAGELAEGAKDKAKAFAEKDSVKKVINTAKELPAKASEIKEGVIADSEVFVENAKTTFRNASKKANKIASKAKESIKEFGKKINGKTATALFEKFYKKVQ